jgi:CRP/FNR family cyclic AMP-dependent transcriptional regulator
MSSSTRPCCACTRAASASSTAWWKTSTPCPCGPKQLLHLVRSYGIPSLSDAREMRIGLQLAQEELAQLLGASRQRVNQELKAMEREDAIRIEPGGLVIRDREALMRIVESDH